MTEERKDEIGKLFLLNNVTDIEGIKKLEIQEIIFLIHSAKYFKEKQAFINDNFDEKIKIFLDMLRDKIKDAEELFIAYDQSTNYPYIDAADRNWIFSKEEYAMTAKDYYMQQLIFLEMKKISGEEIMQTFAILHMLGIKKIMVDNGGYCTEINRNDILPEPDWSNTPQINIPVTNLDLQNAMIRFFQLLYSKSNYEGKEQTLHGLENHMLGEVIIGKYLIPMQLKQEEPSIPSGEGIVTLKKDTIMQFASVTGEEGTSWLPAFTDWAEFEKVYEKNVWSGNIVIYDDLLALSEKMEGIVINCKGISLRINEKNKKMIEEYTNEKNNSNASSVSEHVVEKDTKIMLGVPKEYPSKMIEAIKEYMKKQKSIKKAYLRLMIKDNEKSYLIIVDFDGNKEDLFKGIADAALPYLNGMFIDMIGMDDWARDAIKDTDPFYKKKLFGLF